MMEHNKHELPLHWKQGRAHCVFSPQPPISYGHGETILLAEKDPTQLKLGKSLLEKLQYNVLTARNCEEILACCHTDRIDMVVFDIKIDPSAEQEVLAKARKLQPAIMILPSSTHDVPLGMNSSPAVDKQPVLTKPYTVSSFSQAIKQALSSRKQ